MIFYSLKNIDSSFKMTKTTTFLVIICSAIVNLLVVNWAFSEVAKSRERIYVLDPRQGFVNSAESQDPVQNRPIEARSHVRQFHELFFTLSPDADAINSNIRRALHLADRSAYAYYNDLLEVNYYNRIISTNSIQTIIVDSISINFDYDPPQVMTFATQTLARQSNVTTRMLITSGELESVQRSNNNPHGFLLINFRVVRNEEVSIIRNPNR